MKNTNYDYKNYIVAVIAVVVGILTFLFGEGILNKKPEKSSEISTVNSDYSNSLTDVESEFSSIPPTSEPIKKKGIFLTNLEAINPGGQLSFKEGYSIGGERYSNSIRYESRSMFTYDEDGRVNYDLGKKYSHFFANVGINDKAESSEYEGFLDIILDGEISSYSFKFGENKTIELSVKGVLRMELIFSELGNRRVDNPSDAVKAGADLTQGISSAVTDIILGSPRLSE